MFISFTNHGMNNFLYLRIFIHPSIFNQHRRALWRVFLVIPCFFAFFIAAPSLRPRAHSFIWTSSWRYLLLFLCHYNKKRASNAVWRAAFKTAKNSKKQPFPTALRSHVTQNARMVVFYIFILYLSINEQIWKNAQIKRDIPTWWMVQWSWSKYPFDHHRERRCLMPTV